MKLIAQGAEAKLFEEKGRIVKHRFAKKYRIRQLDETLRKFRTRREAKVFEKLKEIGIAIPDLLSVSDKSMKISMKKIEGSTLRNYLTAVNCAKICRIVGQNIAKMHSADIIHGDLTTSNMIWSRNRIFLIDFGLSFFSPKVEDKAVDLHVLRQAFESTHHKYWDECWEAAANGYWSYEKSEQVLKKLEAVELRGRYKRKSK